MAEEEGRQLASSSEMRSKNWADMAMKGVSVGDGSRIFQHIKPSTEDDRDWANLVAEGMMEVKGSLV